MTKEWEVLSVNLGSDRMRVELTTSILDRRVDAEPLNDVMDVLTVVVRTHQERRWERIQTDRKALEEAASE